MRIDPKAQQDLEDFQDEVQEIDPSEDRDNDADYYNELESNFNNVWK